MSNDEIMSNGGLSPYSFSCTLCLYIVPVPNKNMIKPPKLLKSRRLVLRKLAMKDAATIFETYSSDPEVTKFLAWKPHVTVRETRAFLSESQKMWKAGTEHLWGVFLKDGTMLGSAGIRIVGSKVEIGYVFGRGNWGKGYATEAARCLLSWAMKQKEIYRVWATCDVENGASARILEKIGMQKEGVLRAWIIRPYFGSVPRDCFCFSIIKSRGKHK